MKGLKQLVEQALGTAQDEDQPAPVTISDEAHYALSAKMREWSGWSNARLEFGDPRPISPYASCDHDTKTFIVNPNPLLLNPNRVLLTVTPFRLKQEAVLSGIMLHEAGHARHSHWLPGRGNSTEWTEFLHGDGSTHEGEPVTPATIKLARLMEEARVEGLMARNAPNIGAGGLEWTLRAANAFLAPTTNLSGSPEQQIMDLIRSWALRAGKALARAHWSHGTYTPPPWVGDFTSLLHGVLVEHLTGFGDDGNPTGTAKKIVDQLLLMAVCVDDRGTYMVDSARDVLDMLFPETDPGDMPEAGEGCSAQPGNDDNEESEVGAEESTGEGDESGEQGEGDTEPEDEGSGEDPGAGDSGQDDSDDSTDPEEQASENEGATGSTDDSQAEEEGNADAESESDLAKALREMEERAGDAETEDAEEESEKQDGGTTAGVGGEGTDGKGWRQPTKPEREVQKGAERFLRNMIEPSEASKIMLTDQPSATVDGAQLAAWKAGGQVREPHFFRRTKRSVEPSPPVKMAVLVDISGSMDELQEPSALLSWALSAAALDLRNFAGRGQQIESCLIHWGDDAKVIQGVGENLPGLREFRCWSGTSAMHEALALVEDQMPGFFDPTERPVNRLVVQFTDWDLNPYSGQPRMVREYLTRMMGSGVNMLSVVPRTYTGRRSMLTDLLSGIREQRGHSSLLRYNPSYPGQVWDTASELLDGRTPAPFAGF